MTRVAAVSLWLALAFSACKTGAPPPPSPFVTTQAPPERPSATATATPPSPSPTPTPPPILLHAGGKHAVRGDAGIVTTVEAHATHVGAEVLRSGGNAVDAAVAVAFALAVTHPSAGNIGGGGFMMVRMASGETRAIDFRETAPAAATLAQNQAMLATGGIGYASSGVPGTVAGMVLARDRFGTRPLAELLAPAMTLAKKGHKLGRRQALVLGWSWNKLKRDPAARAIWGSGKVPHPQGTLVKQADLARTLEAIARDGAKGFYEGPVAAMIENAMHAHGGLITAADLRAYEAKERTPLTFSYRGLDVATMPPPSMGGIAFAEIMLLLERWHAHEAPLDSSLSLHLFLEAARRAYADRRRVGADPDFQPPETTQPLVAKLLSGEDLATRTPPLDLDRATPSSLITAEGERFDAGPPESPETTHFSIVDAQGNAVSCTYTQSASFGAKIVIPGTGVLLGNAMGGFSPNGPNAVAPGKRMASSMTPSIVTQRGRLALVLGSPGGDTIPNTVAQVFRGVVDYGLTIDEAVKHARVHHGYLPDRVRVERTSMPPRTALAELEKRGHVVRADAAPLGHANSILIEAATGTAWGVVDPREGGKVEGINTTAP